VARRVQEPFFPGEETILVTNDLRVRTAAALLGLAAVGTSAAGWVDAAPVSLRVVIVLWGGIVAPAFLCVPLARRWIGGPRAAVVSGALFFVLSLHAVVSRHFRLAGAAFAVYATSLTWMLVLAPRIGRAVVVVSRTGRLRRGARGRATACSCSRSRRWWQSRRRRYPFTVWEDAFDHIGFVRRVVTFDSMRPDHVLAWPADATASLAPDHAKALCTPRSPGSGTWPAPTRSLVAAGVLPGFVLAFTAFSQALLRARPLLLLCVALFLLSYAGTAFQLAHAAPYGQNLAAAWYWLLAAVVLSPVRAIAPSRRLVAVAILPSAVR
jgi:hypothetical protein